MLSTARPSRRPCGAPRPAIPILLALGAGTLIAPAADAQAPAPVSTAITASAAMAAAAPATGAPATGAAARVVDGANILDDAAAASAVEKAAKDGITLSILTTTDETSKAEALAKKEWSAKGMGASDALLVINMPASGSNSYYLATGSGIPASKRSELGSDIGSYMRSHDFDGAVAALPGLLAKAKGGGGSGAATRRACRPRASCCWPVGRRRCGDRLRHLAPTQVESLIPPGGHRVLESQEEGARAGRPGAPGPAHHPGGRRPRNRR
ncbi:hypothetical protein ADENT20671_2197 [Actinomyces denticolens]|nr:hypothetical protein ADENT20671_2197 [Actinomyces denticolens]